MPCLQFEDAKNVAEKVMPGTEVERGTVWSCHELVDGSEPCHRGGARRAVTAAGTLPPMECQYAVTTVLGSGLIAAARR